MDNFVAIDFETANYSPSSICSIGAVIYKDGKKVDEFYSLVHPEPDYYSYRNVKIHGITQRDTWNAAIFPKVWEQLVPKLDDLPFVAHNKTFDETCLKAAFRTYSMDYPDYTFYCTLQASRRIKCLADHHLDTVAAFFGYDLKNHHHALADADACAWIAKELL